VNLSNVTGTIGGEAVTISDAEGVGTIVTDDFAVPGETFELTAGADDIPGTDGDDTITGTIVQLDQTGVLAESFNSIDIIDGGKGDDLLKVTTDSTSSVAPAISNVETIEYRAFDAQTFNMQNVSGVESFINNGSSNTLTVTTIPSLIDLTLKNMVGQNMSVGYVDTALTALDDEQKIILDGTRSIDTTTHSTLDLNDGAIETLHFESIGNSANRVEIDDAQFTENLVFSGDQDARVSFLATAVDLLKSVDASDATGGVRVDIATNVTALHKDFSLVGSEGDTHVTTQGLLKTHSYDLGEGSNTLSVNLGATSVSDQVTIENATTLALQANAGSSVSLNTKGVTGTENISLGGPAAGASATITLQNLVNTANTLNWTAADAVATQNLNGVVLSYADVTAEDDEVTLNFTNRNANALKVDRSDGDQVTVNAFTAAGIETININTEHLGADDPDTSGVQGGLAFTAFSADALEVLNIEANTLVDLGSALASTVKTIDASKSTGGVNLDVDGVADTGASGTSRVSITLSEGNDTLDNMGATAATTINTTGGDNTLTLKGANNAITEKLTINAGSGDDTINLNVNFTNSSGANEEVIINLSSGAGDDVINLHGAKANQIGAGVKVTSFEAGNGGDKVGFAASAVSSGSATWTEHAFSKHTPADNTIDVTVDAGMNVIVSSGFGPADLGEATVATWLNDFGGTGSLEFANGTEDEDIYLAVESSAGNTGIFFVEQDAAATTFAGSAANVTKLIELTGVSTDDLTTDNFSTFL
jgi:hypothetical protein